MKFSIVNFFFFRIRFAVQITFKTVNRETRVYDITHTHAKSNRNSFYPVETAARLLYTYTCINCRGTTKGHAAATGNDGTRGERYCTFCRGRPRAVTTVGGQAKGRGDGTVRERESERDGRARLNCASVRTVRTAGETFKRVVVVVVEIDGSEGAIEKNVVNGRPKGKWRDARVCTADGRTDGRGARAMRLHYTRALSQV